MFCENCGNKNEHSTNFCISCGNRLTQENTINNVQQNNIDKQNKNSKKTITIIAIIISCIIAFIVIIFIAGKAIYEHSMKPINIITGTWNCKNFDGYDYGYNYSVEFKLNKNMTFEWNKYDDKKNNYVHGTFTYEDLNKQNESETYSYYYVTITGDKYVINGKEQAELYKSKYEMGVNNNGDEAILMNMATYNMYYCYLQK